MLFGDLPFILRSTMKYMNIIMLIINTIPANKKNVLRTFF